MRTVRQRRLVQELRRLRMEAGLSQQEVAQRAEWSVSKQEKLETGQHAIRIQDVRVLLDLYGLTGEENRRRRETVLQLAREARQRDWWHSYGDVIPRWFEAYVGLESKASVLRNYVAELVPGLLQTADYSRALLRTAPQGSDEEEIERRIAVRKQRQDRLTAEGGPHLWAIFNEPVLHRRLKDADMWLAQLQHIVDMAERPTITVQVLPLAAGLHPAMDGSFMILRFPSPADPDVVYLESQTGSLYLEKPEQVERYSLIYDHLMAKALDPDDSKELIAGMMRDV